MKKPKTKIFWMILGIIVVLFVTSFSSIIDFVTDYQWFQELGYTDAFLKRLTTEFAIGVPLFIVLFLVLRFFMLGIKHQYYKIVEIQEDEKKDTGIRRGIFWVSILVSFMMSTNFASRLWFTFLKFVNSTNFDIKDPIFNNDLALYIFRVPFLREVVGTIISLLFLLAFITLVFYLLLLGLRRPDPGSEFDVYNYQNSAELVKVLNRKLFSKILKQVAFLGLLIFSLIGINYILKSYDLLLSTRGKVFGAGYTDIHVELFIFRALTVASFVSAIGIFVGVLKKNKKLALSGPIAMIGLILIGGIANIVIQKLVVVPNEIVKERPYLEYNINYTQKAFNLDMVNEFQFPVEQKITKEALDKNHETVNNIRINDYRPVDKIYNQLQTLRPYYAFNGVDIDRYVIDGEYRQVFLAARELNQEKLDARAQTWINKHLKYTHGYGLALSPVNMVTREGQPELLVKNLPPITSTDLKIDRPEVYFGEMTNDYIITNTDEKEIDYAIADGSAETIYEGEAGISLGGLNKLLFAIKEGSSDLLFSGAVNSDSKILKYRNIKERVMKIAPFIMYDEDPYLVINQEDGKLYWIIDGYTSSERYPYSQPYKNTRLNYIRNSVKVVVDAYNGKTKFYIYDESDPVIETYSKIFPELFSAKADMPAGLTEHVRYPRLLFDVQAEMYRVYHLDDYNALYNKEDLWDIAREKYMENEEEVSSNYVMFKLPEENEAEFLLNIPYTPSGNNVMTGLLVARNDGENYGQLMLYRFPKDKTVLGPMLVENRIDQSSEISQQLTLWSQKGSTVLRGNTLVVPIDQSLMYVQPIYLKSDNDTSIPEVRRVIVLYENDLVMEESLDKALSKIFGKKLDQAKDDFKDSTDLITGDLDDDVKSIIKRANQLFEEAEDALKESDWASYGEKMDQLKTILKQLNTEDEIENIEE
ncbi:MAG: UPF0182 family protein [Tissierellales bacterium]|nr:UPF0182 family protein [Tissierellales bacterium]